MIQKKRELHLSYSQAFGVARITDKFRPRYSAGVHLTHGEYIFLSPNFESIPNFVNALYINMLYV